LATLEATSANEDCVIRNPDTDVANACERLMSCPQALRANTIFHRSMFSRSWTIWLAVVITRVFDE
jgi:hypothetical protein